MCIIYNGWVGSDMGIVKQTATDGSVIDYVIGSPFLILARILNMSCQRVEDWVLLC